MVKLYNSSAEFAKEFHKHVPLFVQKNVRPETLEKILKFVGVLFVVLPKKDVEEMAKYLYGFVPRSRPRQKVNAVKTTCLVMAQLFTWVYPVAIVVLLVALMPLSVVIGAYHHLYKRKDLFEEISSVNVIIARIVLGVLIMCIWLRLAYEALALCFWLISMLHLQENSLKVIRFLLNVSWWLLSTPLLGLWYILSALLSEPLQLLWSVIHSVFIGAPTALAKWLYHGPVSYTVEKLGLIVSVPLNYLYQVICFVLWVVARPFIWLYLLVRGVFLVVARFTMSFCEGVVEFVQFVMNIPWLLGTFVYKYLYYILPVVVVVFLVMACIYNNKKLPLNNMIQALGMGSFSNSLSKSKTMSRENSTSNDNVSRESNNQGERRNPHYFETTVHSADGRR